MMLFFSLFLWCQPCPWVHTVLVTCLHSSLSPSLRKVVEVVETGNLGKRAWCSWWSWWSKCSCSSCWSKYSGRLFFNKDTLAMVSRVSWVARHQPGSLHRHWSTSWGISGSADFCCQHLNSFYLRASRHCIDWCGQCLQTYLSMCIVAVTVCMKQYFDHFSEHYLV